MKRFFLAALFLFTGIFALAQETTVIPTLDTSTRVPKADRAVLKQYQAELQKNTQAINISRPYTLNFYEYTPTRDFSDLYALSSRISLRYDTIVSLNAIDSPQTDLTGKKLYIPTADGLFIAKKPVTSIDYILQSEYPVYQGEEGKYPTYTIGGNEYYFIVDAKFSPTDRAYYTQKGLVLPIDETILDEETKATTSTTQVSSQNPAKPLDKSVVTSPFGMRISPISGKWLMHKGVDLAAPTGTPIKACKSGTVTYAVAMNPTYGNYVVIDHGGGMTSLYGHMSQILVKKGQKVSTNQVIGKVGSTGLATGPHLHFEIKLNGEPQDPLKYIDK